MSDNVTEELTEEAQIRREIGEHRAAISNLIDRLLELQPIPPEVKENKTLLGVTGVGEEQGCE